MTLISTNTPTAELQALDAAHHVHPFTTGAPTSCSTNDP